MKTITDRKEIAQYIGEWPTVQIRSDYELNSNQIQLRYNGLEVIFKSDNIKDVAYIAMQCHAITNKQYGGINYDHFE